MKSRWLPFFSLVDSRQRKDNEKGWSSWDALSIGMSSRCRFPIVERSSSIQWVFRGKQNRGREAEGIILWHNLFSLSLFQDSKQRAFGDHSRHILVTVKNIKKENNVRRRRIKMKGIQDEKKPNPWCPSVWFRRSEDTVKWEWERIERELNERTKDEEEQEMTRKEAKNQREKSQEPKSVWHTTLSLFSPSIVRGMTRNHQKDIQQKREDSPSSYVTVVFLVLEPLFSLSFDLLDLSSISWSPHSVMYFSRVPFSWKYQRRDFVSHFSRFDLLLRGRDPHVLFRSTAGKIDPLFLPNAEDPLNSLYAIFMSFPENAFSWMIIIVIKEYNWKQVYRKMLT